MGSLETGELVVEQGREVQEERERQEMRVEEVGAPMVPVFAVDVFDVSAHVR